MSHGSDGVEREKLVVGRVQAVAFVATIAFATVAVFNVLVGVPFGAVVDSVACLVMLALKACVSRARSERVLLWATRGILAVPVVVITLVDSFIPGLTLYWLACVPLAAAWLLDDRATLFWTGVSVAGVVVTSLAIAFGLNGEGVDPLIAMGNGIYMSLFMITVGAIAIAARHVIERHMAEVEHHRAEAEHAKAELEAVNEQLAERIQEKTSRLVQALEDVRKSARAKSVLMSNLTHEFRTPLNGVLGASALLSESDLAPDQRELVEALEASGLSLRNILEGILDCVGVESGSLQLSDTAFDPGIVVEGVVAEYTGAGLEKDVVVGAVVLPSTPHTVRGDPARIREILRCLVDNAVKFTDEGCVTVRCWWSDDDHLHLAVEDTGRGFDLVRKEQLFGFLMQGDGGTTREYQGLGVGLGLVRRLLDLMGGDIDVDSEPGRGSTFEAVIPLRGPRFGDDREPLASRRVAIVAEERWGRILGEGLRARGARVEHHEFVEDVFDADVVVLQEPGRDAGSGRSLASQVDGPVVVGDPPLRWRDLEVALAGVLAGEGHMPGHAVLGECVVLVVEDNLLNQKVLKAMLERDGCEVVLASNGREGVEAFRERMDSLQVVLMDCQMPVLDGYGATREIRTIEAERGHAHVPIVAVTANAGPDDRDKCLAAGMDEYVAKPVTPTELGEVLGRVRQVADRAPS